MARSENQGIQIALIVFAFMFILATVGFIYYISENSKNAALAKEKTDELSQLQANAQLQSEKWILLCNRLGISDSADIEQLKTAWQDNVMPVAGPISAQAKNLPEGDVPDADTALDLFAVVKQLDLELQKRGKAVEANKVELKRLEDELARVRQDDADKIGKLEDDLAAATTAHQQAVDRFQETEDQLQSTVTDLTNKLNERTTENNTLQQQLTDAQIAFDAELEKIQQQLDQATTQLAELTNQSFTTPDGIIRLVDQASETVWINLGSADNLRPQITFSVWDKSSSGLGRDGQARKGALEVMRIDGAHSAECRITHQDPLNPITRGDVISTPLWRPGILLGFALVGSMDFDGDAISDRDRIVQLITSNGGKIDAEYKNGEIEGEITVNTQFIIVGKSPPGQEEAVSNMLRTADRLGVQRILLSDFLERSGYRQSRDTKSFGLDSNPADFSDLPVDNNRFRPRRPPTGVGTGSGGNR